MTAPEFSQRLYVGFDAHDRTGPSPYPPKDYAATIQNMSRGL